ncbi:MAG: hypothetical protein B1H13_13455 [Desulfobacteraceae bacterium 4484_190.3]|nr:MAG: hypothetical protein B1H13_13455 [Desulfobacteraceae bacterium 4484_190.3]
MNKLRSRICPLFFLILVLLLAGCTNRHTTLESFLDTPKHHASNGFSFLHRGQISDAEREFQSALRLDPFFSQAHCGLGLIAGMREEYDTAFKSMALARDKKRKRHSKRYLHLIPDFFGRRTGNHD